MLLQVEAMKEDQWIFPGVECVQPVSFAFAIGTIAATDFSVLGIWLSRKSTPRLCPRHVAVGVSRRKATRTTNWRMRSALTSWVDSGTILDLAAQKHSCCSACTSPWRPAGDKPIMHGEPAVKTDFLSNGRTYIRPHRHLHPPKSETFLVLEGAADVILFDESGALTARYRLGVASAEGRIWGVDLAHWLWHTIVARSARVICFEVKPGPWDPFNDKEFAPWAPAENNAAATAYLQTLVAGG